MEKSNWILVQPSKYEVAIWLHLGSIDRVEVHRQTDQVRTYCVWLHLRDKRYACIEQFTDESAAIAMAEGVMAAVDAARGEAPQESRRVPAHG